ncbi:MAG TPA: hypothetical protein VNA17_01735 [Pyrinomonadaceae bacterium]|nr:hypothetical protein [Pyrinomonadaceae bacterium]
MKSNHLTGLLAIAALLTLGLGCSSLTSTVTNTNTTTSNTAPANTTKPADTTTTTAPSNMEKADFTMTSEELDAEFNRKGVTSKELEKYSSKNIAVTGRVTMLVTEKKGTTQPWVTLYAPGLGNGVSCYFDDEDVAQMKLLKEDKIVKVQGFQDDFIVPEISPMLKHCQVIEGAK